MDLCKKFPTFTNVMLSYFKNVETVATSARFETYFGQVKASMEKVIPRVDKFLVQHCSNIDSDIKVARAALNNLKVKNVPIKNVVHKGHDYLLETERWKNKCSGIVNENIFDIKNGSTENSIEIPVNIESDSN